MRRPRNRCRPHFGEETERRDRAVEGIAMTQKATTHVARMKTVKRQYPRCPRVAAVAVVTAGVAAAFASVFGLGMNAEASSRRGRFIRPPKTDARPEPTEMSAPLMRGPANSHANSHANSPTDSPANSPATRLPGIAESSGLPPVPGTPIPNAPTTGVPAVKMPLRPAPAWERYPKFQGGFHSRQLYDLGVPTGDRGLRGNGFSAYPW